MQPLAETPAQDRVKILLVDDTPDNLVSLEAALEGLGQQLVLAGSGMEALRHLGFLPMQAPHMLTRGPLYFAGTPWQRLDDLYRPLLRVWLSRVPGLGAPAAAG